ncbi:MAG TPA: TonB-dependent receptor, partial [Dyadobacter sp.]|nr:TonB-dependent receptor [Dyadobacter sp.]
MNLELRSKSTRHIFTSILLLCSLPGMAQLYVHGTIKGITGEGIPGVAVQIKNSPRGEHTDVEGKFRINGLKTGTYQLIFSAVGYKNQQRDVTLKSGQNPEMLIVIEENPQNLNEVRVVGKTEARELKDGAYNVSALDTKAFANTSSDINQVLNRMSGVRIQESGGLGSDFRFSLNGLSGNHIKFFIDGIPMESYGGGLSLNNIPVNLAERIEVYKGVVPAYLGSDALGGAVNIVTKGKGNN